MCHAEGTGGDIDVSCNSTGEGTLVVEENSWSGWRAQIDGEPAQLLEGNWLSVKGARACTHTRSAIDPGTSHSGSPSCVLDF